jgi:lactoylglutathione lyase
MTLRGRYLHTMIHVADLERSVDFYTRVLGMTVLRRGEAPEEGRRNAFIGYEPEESAAAIELTAYDDGRRHAPGDGFGHLALGFDDVRAACAAIAAAGGNVTRAPFVIASGKTIAFVSDPDGYSIELVQSAPA